MENNLAVSLQNVEFAYTSSGGECFDVLRGFTADIPYGQIVGLVGRNASGKSTLLDILRGSLVPRSGVVRVDGILVSSDGKRFQRPEVSLISQRPDAGLAPSMTVYENYILAVRRHNFTLRWAYSRRMKEACCSLISRAKMGLEDKLNEQVRFLSGGQQQGLSILLALNGPERVLLLDEPTAALDAFTSELVLGLAISEIKSRRGVSILVSHRIRDLLERCDRVIALRDGITVYDADLVKAKLNEHDLLDLLSS